MPPEHTKRLEVLIAVMIAVLIGMAVWVYSQVNSTEQKVNQLGTPDIVDNTNGKLTLKAANGQTIDLGDFIEKQVRDQLAAQTPEAEESQDEGQSTGDAVQPTTTPSPTDNDSQTLSLSQNILSISGGNSVTLPQQSFTEEDGVVGNEVLAAATNGGLVRSGSGTAADPYKLGLQSCGTNEVLKYNGTDTWACAADSGGTSYTADGQGIELSGTVFGLELDGASLSKSASGLSLNTSNANSWTVAQTFSADATVTTDSASAFRVLSGNGSGSVPYFVVDTTSSRVYIGNPTTDTTGALLVLDTKSGSGDPTGVAGSMYYNGAAQKMRCYEGDGYWVDCRPSARSSYFHFDDFMSNTNSNATGPVFKSTVSGTGANNASVTGATGHPGILEQLTGTTTSGRAAMLTGSTSTTDAIQFGNGDAWRIESTMRLLTLSDGTERYTYRNGFLDSATGESTDGCFFRYVDDVNGGRWQGTCRNNSSESSCDTTITVAANTWYKLEVVVNAAGSSVDFKIGGTSRCQIASSIPTASGRACGFGSLIVKSLGTTERQAQIDYIEVNGTLASAR